MNWLKALQSRNKKAAPYCEAETFDKALGRHYMDILPEKVTSGTSSGLYRTELLVLAELCHMYPEMAMEFDSVMKDRPFSVALIQHIGLLNKKLGTPVVIEGNASLLPSQWLSVMRILSQTNMAQVVDQHALSNEKQPVHEASLHQYCQEIHQLADTNVLGSFATFFTGNIPGRDALLDSVSYGVALGSVLPVIFSGLTGASGNQMLVSITSGIMVAMLGFSHCIKRNMQAAGNANKMAIFQYLVNTVPNSWEEVVHSPALGAAFLRANILEYGMFGQKDLSPKVALMHSLLAHSLSKQQKTLTPNGNIVGQDEMVVAQYFDSNVKTESSAMLAPDRQMTPEEPLIVETTKATQ